MPFRIKQVNEIAKFYYPEIGYNLGDTSRSFNNLELIIDFEESNYLYRFIVASSHVWIDDLQ
jgi:hypothetical protein